MGARCAPCSAAPSGRGCRAHQPATGTVSTRTRSPCRGGTASAPAARSCAVDPSSAPGRSYGHRIVPGHLPLGLGTRARNRRRGSLRSDGQGLRAGRRGFPDALGSAEDEEGEGTGTESGDVNVLHLGNGDLRRMFESRCSCVSACWNRRTIVRVGRRGSLPRTSRARHNHLPRATPFEGLYSDLGAGLFRSRTPLVTCPSPSARAS